MGVYIDDNKLVITTEPKNICLVLPKGVGKNLKHEADSIIKHNDFFVENKIKKEIDQLLSKYKQYL